MNPNIAQAEENEVAGEEDLGEEIDLDAIYGGEEIFVPDFEPSKELKHDLSNVLGDVVKQGTKETLIGLGGTYGDLLELAGLGGKGQTEKKSTQEFEALERMQQPGYTPTAADLEALSSDTTAPESFSLPTSEDLRAVNEAVGGPGEAETPYGEAAGRAGRIYGSGLAFGQVNPVPAVASGVAGQAVKELGGGPLLQGAAEIVTLLATQGKGAKPISSSQKAIQDVIENLRNLGYSEEQITLAINAQHKGAKVAQKAMKGEKTKQAFEDFAERSEELISDIFKAEVPGIESGTKKVHELASNAYDQVAQRAGNIIIKDASPFNKAVQQVEQQLSKNLGKNPDAQAFLNRLKSASTAASKNPSADSFMNFYKELNSMGKWMGRSQRDRLINQVKDGIKDTFKAEGKTGQKLAEDFEKVNKGVRKAYLAEDLSEVITKATVDGKLDFKKLSKAFEIEDNVKMMQELLGPQQAQNMKTIAKTGREIKDFDKAWKGVKGIEVSKFADAGRAALGSYFLYQGDWEKLALVVATKGGKGAVAKLREKSLTDPKFQNLLIRGLHGIKTGSSKLYRSAETAMNEYLKEQGIDIEL